MAQMEEDRKYIDLVTLQECIRGQVEGIEAWVQAEVESCRYSSGHCYLDLIQKSPKGAELSRARGIIWRSHADIISYFEFETGKKLSGGITVLVYVSVSYDPRFGLSLIVKDIDADFTIGQRELERQATIKALTDEGLLDAQKELALPFLPGRMAVISSVDAAGYGDFMKQLGQNSHGFVFDTTLFHSIMQGDRSPSSVIEALGAISKNPGAYDLVVIMRGGGAAADMFCFDDYEMCRAIASCPLPVLTAIGHDRDFHIADMVANAYFKTPTALAAFLTDWTADTEAGWMNTVAGIRRALENRIQRLDDETKRCVSNIGFALKAAIGEMDHNIALLQASIASADPRGLLRQGYVLASDMHGRLLKNASSAEAGDNFFLRFMDGRWDCEILGITKENQGL